jgi:hypothetical protein
MIFGYLSLLVEYTILWVKFRPEIDKKKREIQQKERKNRKKGIKKREYTPEFKPE